MDLFQAVILALIQGLTEILPISSSAHLILPSQLLGWQDQGQAFDVALHVGTVVAIITYFRKDLIIYLQRWLHSWSGQHTTESNYAWGILFATIPIGIIGLLFHHWIEIHLRSALVIAVQTIAFGVLLGWADYRGKSAQWKNSMLNWKIVLIIGCAQALALIPGTSRSGVTMTAGLFCGMDRTAAARFAFLLAIPTILSAGLLDGFELASHHEAINWNLLLLAVALAGITTYSCIQFFFRFMTKIGMMPFVIYRLLLGVFLFLFITLNGLH